MSFLHLISLYTTVIICRKNRWEVFNLGNVFPLKYYPNSVINSWSSPGAFSIQECKNIKAHEIFKFSHNHMAHSYCDSSSKGKSWKTTQKLHCWFRPVSFDKWDSRKLDMEQDLNDLKVLPSDFLEMYWKVEVHTLDIDLFVLFLVTSLR